MSLTEVQINKISQILSKLEAKIVNKLSSEEIATELKNIKTLLEQNAELYNTVRRPHQVIRGHQMGGASGSAFATMAVTANNLLFLMNAYKVSIYTNQNKSMSEDDSTFDINFIMNVLVPILHTLTGAFFYAFVRFANETTSCPALANITRVDIDSFLSLHKKGLSKDNLESLKQKLATENNLLTKCLAAQTKDTWIGTAGAAAASFASSQVKGFWGIPAAIFKPMVADLMFRGFLGSRKEHIESVDKLERDFPQPRGPRN